MSTEFPRPSVGPAYPRTGMHRRGPAVEGGVRTDGESGGERREQASRFFSFRPRVGDDIEPT